MGPWILFERKIVWAEAQIWGRRGEICASGAPNDISRLSETQNTPIHYPEEPKKQVFHILYSIFTKLPTSRQEKNLESKNCTRFPTSELPRAESRPFNYNFADALKKTNFSDYIEKKAK